MKWKRGKKTYIENKSPKQSKSSKDTDVVNKDNSDPLLRNFTASMNGCNVLNAASEASVGEDEDEEEDYSNENNYNSQYENTTSSAINYSFSKPNKENYNDKSMEDESINIPIYQANSPNHYESNESRKNALNPHESIPSLCAINSSVFPSTQLPSVIVANEAAKP